MSTMVSSVKEFPFQWVKIVLQGNKRWVFKKSQNLSCNVKSWFVNNATAIDLRKNRIGNGIFSPALFCYFAIH